MEKTIEQRLHAAGYDHRRDEGSTNDGRHTVFDINTGNAIGRLTASDALHMEEAFFWTSANGARWVYLVRKIQQTIDAHPESFGAPILVGISADQYAHVMANQGVEEWRINRLTPQHRDRPVLFAEQGDGTHLLIDGNHRVVRRWRDGYRDALAYLLPLEFWHPHYGWQIEETTT